MSRLDWRNQIASEEAARIGFPPSSIVPLSQIMRPMPMLHKNTKWSCKPDCTHYCYHPELWSALLDGLYRRLMKWALTAPPHATVDGALSGGGIVGTRRGERRAQNVAGNWIRTMSKPNFAVRPVHGRRKPIQS